MEPILAYNDNLKRICGLSAKPEPYLHFAYAYHMIDDDFTKVTVAVYIWDTREIVEARELGLGKANMRIAFGLHTALSQSVRVRDNGQPLTGENADAVNKALGFKRKR